MDSSHQINIERALLSSIFFEPEIIEDIMGVLKYQDFYLVEHQKIFKAMEELFNKSQPIDEEFVKQKVKENVHESIILEIISANPIINTDAYIAQIKELSIKKELGSLALNIKKTIDEDDVDSAEALDRVQKELYQISTDSAMSDFKDSIESAELAMEHIRKMKALGSQYLIGQTTGFIDLDKRTTGFGAGDLIILAARPAMGKTSLVLEIARKNIEKGDGVIFFSLEMGADQLMMRILSAKTSIPLQALRKGDLNDEQWENLGNAVDDLSKKKFFIDDGGSLNINQLRSKVRKLMGKEDNIKLIVIDYLQLMSGTGNKDRHLEVSEISRGLKMLARELQIPIVALSQLNRGVESRPDKRPMLSDLRESGAIEQDADIIMFVYRDDVYKEREERDRAKKAADEGREYVSKFEHKNEEEAEIIIGKQRNGPIGTVKLLFQKHFTRFADMEKEFIETVYESADISESKVDVGTLSAPPSSQSPVTPPSSSQLQAQAPQQSSQNDSVDMPMPF
jgi:replicative DNA helicase